MTSSISMGALRASGSRVITGISTAEGKWARSPKRGGDRRKWKIRTDELEELIRRVLIHTTCSLDKLNVLRPRRSSLHEALLEGVRPKDTLITFNYDTTIEESMPLKGVPLWTPRDGYGIDTVGVTHTWARRWHLNRHLVRHPSSHLNLLKLPGSLICGAQPP